MNMDEELILRGALCESIMKFGSIFEKVHVYSSKLLPTYLGYKPKYGMDFAKGALPQFAIYEGLLDELESAFDFDLEEERGLLEEAKETARCWCVFDKNENVLTLGHIQ